jgi:hypothetical protein
MSAEASAVAVDDPLTRPRSVIVGFGEARDAALQRAASEGRLEAQAEYAVDEYAPRSSYIGVVRGVMGFFTFLAAASLVISVASRHQMGDSYLQLTGFTPGVLILVNLALGYGMIIGHEWLHAEACRILDGKATLAPPSNPVQEQPLIWSARMQGFTRRGYLIVLLAPFVVVLVVWVVFLIVFAPVAAFTIVPATVNAAMSGADLWIARAALRYPANAIFADRHPGFTTYTIVEAKAGRKRTTTRPTATA